MQKRAPRKQSPQWREMKPARRAQPFPQFCFDFIFFFLFSTPLLPHYSLMLRNATRLARPTLAAFAKSTPAVNIEIRKKKVGNNING